MPAPSSPKQEESDHLHPHRSISWSRGLCSRQLSSRQLSSRQLKKRVANNHLFVQWGDVVLREFPSILGDNVPSDGAPLGIGWKPKSKKVVPVEQYEYFRISKVPRRPRPDLKLSSGDRNAILLGHGYSILEVMAVSAESDNIRKSRQANIKSGGRFDSFRKVLLKETRGIKKTPSLLSITSSARGLLSELGGGCDPQPVASSAHCGSPNRRSRLLRTPSESVLQFSSSPSSSSSSNRLRRGPSLGGGGGGGLTRQSSESQLLMRSSSSSLSQMRSSSNLLQMRNTVSGSSSNSSNGSGTAPLRQAPLRQPSLGSPRRMSKRRNRTASLSDADKKELLVVLKEQRENVLFVPPCS